MLQLYQIHNQFWQDFAEFAANDPHLHSLNKLQYQYMFNWWRDIDFNESGIYILTGGRQIGKSTSCKLLIKHCLQEQIFPAKNIFYLPCDEIFDAKELSQIIRNFFQNISNEQFLLIIDEITSVDNWERVIKAIADEGFFTRGICLLTGSDTVILKEASMSFPGRRGNASKTDFHMYPLSFSQYVGLVSPDIEKDNKLLQLQTLFNEYLQCGGYLRAINNLKQQGQVLESTYLTYEQWIRGDFLKKGKNEQYLLAVLNALITVGLSPISYSSLTQKIGMISKETCIDYCRLLQRMDVLLTLQAYDQNTRQGFPRKDRKFHFTDPFILQTINRWLQREGFGRVNDLENIMVEATAANHCARKARTYYFKSTQGEVDIISLQEIQELALEVKWSNQIRPNDFKVLNKFPNRVILSKTPQRGQQQGTNIIPVYEYLYNLAN